MRVEAAIYSVGIVFKVEYHVKIHTEQKKYGKALAIDHYSLVKFLEKLMGSNLSSKSIQGLL